MPRRHAPRLLAATAALLLAASGVGASLPPQTTAAAKRCCTTRCEHGAAGAVHACCCAAPTSPAATVTVPDGRPVGSTSALAVGLPACGSVTPHRSRTLVQHIAPGRSLFLQRCTLVL